MPSYKFKFSKDGVPVEVLPVDAPTFHEAHLEADKVISASNGKYDAREYVGMNEGPDAIKKPAQTKAPEPQAGVSESLYPPGVTVEAGAKASEDDLPTAEFGGGSGGGGGATGEYAPEFENDLPPADDLPVPPVTPPGPQPPADDLPVAPPPPVDLPPADDLPVPPVTPPGPQPPADDLPVTPPPPADQPPADDLPVPPATPPGPQPPADDLPVAPPSPPPGSQHENDLPASQNDSGSSFDSSSSSDFGGGGE